MEKFYWYIGKCMGPDDQIFLCLCFMSQFHTTAAVEEGLICRNTSWLIKEKTATNTENNMKCI